jgi:hypothetical protein
MQHSTLEQMSKVSGPFSQRISVNHGKSKVSGPFSPLARSWYLSSTFATRLHTAFALCNEPLHRRPCVVSRCSKCTALQLFRAVIRYASAYSCLPSHALRLDLRSKRAFRSHSSCERSTFLRAGHSCTVRVPMLSSGHSTSTVEVFTPTVRAYSAALRSARSLCVRPGSRLGCKWLLGRLARLVLPISSPTTPRARVRQEGFGRRPASGRITMSPAACVRARAVLAAHSCVPTPTARVVSGMHVVRCVLSTASEFVSLAHMTYRIHRARMRAPTNTEVKDLLATSSTSPLLILS